MKKEVFDITIWNETFGKVVEGMDVVPKIQQQKDNNQTLVDQVKIYKMAIR